MYIEVCIYIYILHLFIFVCIFVCMYIYIYMYLHICIYINIQIHLYHALVELRIEPKQHLPKLRADEALSRRSNAAMSCLGAPLTEPRKEV